MERSQLDRPLGGVRRDRARGGEPDRFAMPGDAFERLTQGA